MSGFGRKSYDNIIEAVNKARKIILPKFIYSLGILNIGLANAKMICKEFDYNLDDIMSADIDALTSVEGIGEIIAKVVYEYFRDEENLKYIKNLLTEITFEEVERVDSDSEISGKVFVITGSVEHFGNRNEVKDVIESKGGKVTGSVTSKTDYLINNDITSNSSK